MSESRWILAVHYVLWASQWETAYCFHFLPVYYIIRNPASQLLCLPPAFKLASYSVSSSTLKMDAIWSSETSIDFQWVILIS